MDFILIDETGLHLSQHSDFEAAKTAGNEFDDDCYIIVESISEVIFIAKYEWQPDTGRTWVIERPDLTS